MGGGRNRLKGAREVWERMKMKNEKLKMAFLLWFITNWKSKKSKGKGDVYF